jgi:electron transfer flavoprotein beta subunit
VKALVLIKKTPDTETKIVLSGDGKGIDAANTKYIMSPYDENAVEEALVLKQKLGSLEVVVASFGPPDTKEVLIKALAMGADRAILVSNSGLEQADSLATAKVLAAVAQKESPDLILCGKQAIDDDNMHVGIMLAEFLGWPHVNVVNKLDISGNSGTAEREVEGGQIETYQFNLPVIIGANKSLNTPRFTSLPGIMKAKKKPFDEKNPADFGLEAGKLAADIKTKIIGYKYPMGKAAGKIFKGEEAKVMVDKVVNLLREEAKVL